MTTMLAAAKAEPHFVPLATVPLGDGARAAAVLKDAMKAGFAGAMIGTLPRGVGSTLDAADLDPFWQAADETGAFIHIHPSFDAGDVRVNDFDLANGLGRITDAVIDDGAADLGRPCREIQEREILRADGRGRAALRARAGSSAITRSRPASAIRSRRLPRSIPTPSCTTRAC